MATEVTSYRVVSDTQSGKPPRPFRQFVPNPSLRPLVRRSPPLTRPKPALCEDGKNMDQGATAFLQGIRNDREQEVVYASVETTASGFFGRISSPLREQKLCKSKGVLYNCLYKFNKGKTASGKV